MHESKLKTKCWCALSGACVPKSTRVARATRGLIKLLPLNKFVYVLVHIHTHTGRATRVRPRVMPRLEHARDPPTHMQSITHTQRRVSSPLLSSIIGKKRERGRSRACWGGLGGALPVYTAQITPNNRCQMSNSPEQASLFRSQDFINYSNNSLGWSIKIKRGTLFVKFTQTLQPFH
jgi:hypothetical protein